MFAINNTSYSEVLDTSADVISKQYGARIYKQVKKTSITMYKGMETKRKKGLHTWIENMSEQEFLEETAFAFSNKGVGIQDVGNTSRTKYYSKFSDGCNVTLIIENPKIINGISHNNYLSAILINP